MDAFTATGTAALVAVVIALTKVIEHLVKKYSKSSTTPSASLAPDQARQLRESHEKFILIERDITEMKKSNNKIADAMVQIADCVKKTSETNEKVAALVEKIDRRQELEEEIRRRNLENSHHHPIAKAE